MFKSVELGLKVSKEQYARQLPKLRAALLTSQAALKGNPIPVIVIVAGVEGAGKAEVVNTLNEWLDPRGLETHAFWPLSEEERERPRFWRFWRTLPARGRIGIFFGSWYTQPILQRVLEDGKLGQFDRELQHIVAFEKMLVDDGALIIKLWFHLSKDAQHAEFKRLEKNPLTRWRVSPADWKQHKHYNKFVAASERAIRFTDTGEAPWFLIDSSNSRHRNLQAGQLLLDALRQRMEKSAPPVAHRTITHLAKKTLRSLTLLDSIDLRRRLADTEYKSGLEQFQAWLNRLTWAAHEKKRSTIIVFEGWDAAGKGGCIRRLVTAIDAKLHQVISVAAPTDEERARHYLWRFWRHIPPAGMVTIYDRSWYGRVLVERVEGFARPEEWKRAYLEINEFEAELAEHGIVVVKFWLHISPAEQLRRFQERQRIAYKRHKISAEDWRNREKWSAYEVAVNDMLIRTNTDEAPWTLVPANDKRFARIKVIKTVCQRLER